MMARSSKAPSIGRIQKRKTNFSKSSFSTCNAWPVHTDGPEGDLHLALRQRRACSGLKMPLSELRAAVNLILFSGGEQRNVTATPASHKMRKAMTGRSNSLRPFRWGLSLGTFFVVAYLTCLASALIVPDRALHQVWLQFLPGFSWTLPGMLIGLVEAFVYGLFSGILFGPIYNVSNAQSS
jgi:hypothetical protein